MNVCMCAFVCFCVRCVGESEAVRAMGTYVPGEALRSCVHERRKNAEIL
jgi:hypothetical protein